IKRVRSKLPEVEALLGNPFAIDGVEVAPTVELDGVLYMHGYRSDALSHAKCNLQSVVHGHLHSASLQFFQLKGKARFNLCAGWLADVTSPVFKYRAKAIDMWTLGCGLVTDGVPQLLVYPGSFPRIAVASKASIK